MRLQIGDVVVRTDVMAVSFMTHDMLYVGSGYVVQFERYRGRAVIELIHLSEILRFGEFKFVGRQEAMPSMEKQFDIYGLVDFWAWLYSFGHHAGVWPAHEGRGAIAMRALASLGEYTYNAVRFNCQHCIQHIVQGEHAFHYFSLSNGTSRAIYLIGFCILLIFTLSFVVALRKNSKQTAPR
jgi:hypothetical protein